ncbi:MAG: hypothetical protein GW917_00920 [Bdellovibrionales bacterium]|nr:hypothetical protein [Bdellovibrionales bacterium]
MKVSVLTIGTEITTGEILNTNVQWISERLEALGLDVVHHLTVADHWEVMKGALDYLSSSEVLVVTGGLGPTQDDLTRELVADWVGSELEFSNAAYRDLAEKLQSRGRVPMESHKKQCYFPKQAQVLNNSVGTAHGFSIHKGRNQIFVLPGPPRELKPMWTDHVEPLLPKGELTPWVKWIFRGLPESEVADRFERVLAQFIDPKKIEIGYRASPPHIHVKVRKRNVPEGLIEKVAEEFVSVIVDRV